ncbi:MAG: M48 family metalloprotease, partial [Verrucomicrobiota bacterium]
LVAGLNTRQLAAVVAHELGHCTQSFAMRLGFIIDKINRWFFRVVYERDTWDEALAEWSDSIDDWRLSLVAGCVHLAVWLSRKLLALLMLAGHAASCFLSRQMEYHADACAMAVAGSEGLESLLLRLRELSVLEQIGYQGLGEFWEKRRQVPENLPDFLERLEKGLPAEFHESARMTLLNETASLFATHPTPAQRIQKARRKAEPGMYAQEKPARGLFRDFATTARAVSARHYRDNLGLPVTDLMLKPAHHFFTDTSRTEAPHEQDPISNSTLKLRRAASSSTVEH